MQTSKKILTLFFITLALCATAATLSLYRTNFRFGSYQEVGTLGDYLFEDYSHRTNGGSAYQAGKQWVWSLSTLNWNTNSILYRDGVRARGATAMIYNNEYSCFEFCGQRRYCMLTKHIGISAGHIIRDDRIFTLTNPMYYGGSNLVFVSITNGLRYYPGAYIVGGVSNSLSLADDMINLTNSAWNYDFSFCILTNGLADDVESMRIAKPFYTNIVSDINTLKEPFVPYVNRQLNGAPDIALPVFIICQHWCIGRVSYDYHDEYVHNPFFWPGDSGSPRFILYSNECVFVGGSISYQWMSDAIVRKVDAINAYFGFNTNDPANQLQYVWLTNWPLVTPQ